MYMLYICMYSYNIWSYTYTSFFKLYIVFIEIPGLSNDHIKIFIHIKGSVKVKRMYTMIVKAVIPMGKR